MKNVTLKDDNRCQDLIDRNLNLLERYANQKYWYRLVTRAYTRQL